jgi:NAD(P)-dependent dehydrogenase (short-subunit alcohol dehydrogenase family)
MTVSVTAPSPLPDRTGLAGRSALVTGAGPAGVATARALASAGASVALAGEDDLALLRTVRAIEAGGGRAVALPADLQEAHALRRVVACASESFGSLHLAVNTIGAVDGARSDVHAGCRAVYLAMSLELPALLAAGGGAIVNAAANPLGRHTEESHCIVGLTRAAAIDHLDRGVRVNAIVSGESAADFAAVALWLCSDRAADVTGAAIPAGLRPASAAQPTQPGRTRPYS